MTRPVRTAAETRAAEAALIASGTSVEALMETAGAGVAEAAWRHSGDLPTLVLCGPGNNGGDGYVVARTLAERGVAVRVAAAGEPRTGAAAQARARWAGPVEAVDGAVPAARVIDGLFGTGLARPLDGGSSGALARVCAAARVRIAIDLPSGISTDDGALLGAVPRFDLTVAPGCLKPAHLLQPAAALCGRVATVDIGLATGVRTTLVERPALGAPGPADHKYTRGYVAVAAGAMAGAARLAAGAAQRAGAGYVLLAGGSGGGADALVSRAAADGAALAGLLADARIGAVAIGPGLGRGADAADRIDAALASGRPLVIDADALAALRGRLPLAMPAVLTPHEGEFARLFGTLPGGKLERVRAAAVRAGAVVLLKGADSVVAAPDGRAAIAPPTSHWLASAGTGDVLAGIVAAMVAGGLPPFEAACAALWLHGEAARRAGPALIADDLVAHLAAARGACA